MQDKGIRLQDKSITKDGGRSSMAHICTGTMSLQGKPEVVLRPCTQILCRDVWEQREPKQIPSILPSLDCELWEIMHLGAGSLPAAELHSYLFADWVSEWINWIRGGRCGRTGWYTGLLPQQEHSYVPTQSPELGDLWPPSSPTFQRAPEKWESELYFETHVPHVPLCLSGVCALSLWYMAGMTRTHDGEPRWACTCMQLGQVSACKLLQVCTSWHLRGFAQSLLRAATWLTGLNPPAKGSVNLEPLIMLETCTVIKKGKKPNPS